MPELEADLEKFIEEYVNSFIKWDLITYFYNNVGVFDAAHALAIHLGRKESDVTKALSELAEKKLIMKVKRDGEDVYHYSPSIEISEMVSSFIEALEIREKRLLILTKMLRIGARE